MRKVFLVLCAVVLLSLTFLSVNVLAEDDVKQQYQEVKEEIERLQRQIAQTESEERTLTNQITQFNNQITVTGLQIDQTRREIQQLVADIDILESQINGLEITLEKISTVLSDRAVESYQRGKVTPLKLLVAADGFETFVTRYAYLSYMQDYDKQILLKIQDDQNDISDKKTELETKQKEVETKNKQLVTLKTQLDSQKKAKETLLEVTKNDEARFKKLLEAARSKESQLAQLIFKDGKIGYSMGIFSLSKSGSVSKGARIGTMGNSGSPRCSTAAHLHFEVIENAKLTNDEVTGDLISGFAHLEQREVSYFTSNNTIDVDFRGAGKWQWPLANPTITQEFGKTPWSSRYLSGFHTGIDMVDYNDKTVRAPANGTLYYAKIACGNPINIAIIDYGSNLLSLFLHLE